MSEDCYVPKEEHVTTQDPNNKQGGTETTIPFVKVTPFKGKAKAWKRSLVLS